MLSWSLLLQEVAAPPPDWLQSMMNFLDTPAPYSPLTEYLAILFLLWLLARRDNRRNTFDHKAQEVLERKLQEGEIDRKTYEKYRQEMSLRPKR